MIALVNLEVLGEVQNFLGQQRDLNLGRTRVPFVSLELSDDPHVKLTDRQRKQRYDLEVRLLNAASASNEARNTLSTLKSELTSRTKAEGFAKAPKNLQEDVKKTLEKVIQLQEFLREGKFARRVVEKKPVPVKPQEDKPAPTAAPPLAPAPRPSSLLAPGYSRISNALFSIDSISEAPSQAQMRDADSILRDLRPVLDNINGVLRSAPSLSDKLKANKLKPLTPTQEILR